MDRIWCLNSIIYPMELSSAVTRIIYEKGSWQWYNNVHYIIVSPPLYHFLCLMISPKCESVHFGIYYIHLKITLTPTLTPVLIIQLIHQIWNNGNMIIINWLNTHRSIDIGQKHISSKNVVSFQKYDATPCRKPQCQWNVSSNGIYDLIIFIVFSYTFPCRWQVWHDQCHYHISVLLPWHGIRNYISAWEIYKWFNA